ncbi:MAG: type IV toxin-antitoxin system AbiEi family antitoxin domain-containing protein [Actinomycetes bacterium]
MAALHVIASLLADRHGVFTREQLRSAGVSSKRVRHALECGLWVSVLHGAFVAAAQPVGPWQRGAAAVAVTGGVVSHHSAATLLGLALPTDTVHVTTGRTPRYVPAGVTAHHVELGGRDTCRRLGVVVTSPQRTAVDCAAALPFGSAMDFVREAMFTEAARRLSGSPTGICEPQGSPDGGRTSSCVTPEG